VSEAELAQSYFLFFSDVFKVLSERHPGFISVKKGMEGTGFRGSRQGRSGCFLAAFRGGWKGSYCGIGD
jgi:hypothetical protein